MEISKNKREENCRLFHFRIFEKSKPSIRSGDKPSMSLRDEDKIFKRLIFFFFCLKKKSQIRQITRQCKGLKFQRQVLTCQHNYEVMNLPRWYLINTLAT